MAPIYSKATVTAVSESPDVSVDSIRIIHGCVASIRATTQADNVLVGRDRFLLFYSVRSAAVCKAKPRIRRHSKARIAASTATDCKFLTTIPAIPAPIGRVFLEGKPLKEKRLPKGKSYSFSFNITGKRLVGLRVGFTLRNLRGEAVLQKTLLVAPGGVTVDELIENTDGTQTIVGSVILLPFETLFEGSPSEYELNYILTIGNGSSREYLLESDFVNFYSV